MLEAATVEAKKVESELRELLQQSDQLLAPLCDPLHANAGLNRWLRNDNEEAYSDWLAWILQQFNGAEVVSLLQIEDEEITKYCSSNRFSVFREVSIPNGRLDVAVEFGEKCNDALMVIEVKTTSAEQADTAKQKGYRAWLDAQAVRHKPRPILLVVDAEKDDYEGFAPLQWSELCLRLREMLPGLSARIGLVRTAMVVAFIGAAESNLLHFVAPDNMQRERSVFYARTADHLMYSLLRIRGLNGPK